MFYRILDERLQQQAREHDTTHVLYDVPVERQHTDMACLEDRRVALKPGNLIVQGLRLVD